MVNGKYVVKTFKGVTVPAKKLAELEQFKVDFFASKGITHVSEYKAITQKATVTTPVQETSDVKAFNSLGDELELQGNEIYLKDTEEGEGGLYMEYNTVEEAAEAFKALQSPNVSDSEVRNTEENVVSLPESKKSVANLIKDAKNASTTREVKNAGRRKPKKSKVKKVTKSKTDIDNSNSGPIDQDCKG